MRTSFKVKCQRSRSPGRLLLKPKVYHIYRTGRPMNFNKKDGYRQRNVRQFLQSAISLRHIIWLPRESRRYVVAGAGIWLHQEIRSHILASPGTIAVNFTWIEREFNACQTPRSIYTSIFNCFPVIQPVSLKVRHFSTFFAHFGLPWVHPWDNRGKCHTVVKRI